MTLARAETPSLPSQHIFQLLQCRRSRACFDPITACGLTPAIPKVSRSPQPQVYCLRLDSDPHETGGLLPCNAAEPAHTQETLGCFEGGPGRDRGVDVWHRTVDYLMGSSLSMSLVMSDEGDRPKVVPVCFASGNVCLFVRPLPFIIAPGLT